MNPPLQHGLMQTASADCEGSPGSALLPNTSSQDPLVVQQFLDSSLESPHRMLPYCLQWECRTARSETCCDQTIMTCNGKSAMVDIAVVQTK